MSASFPRKRRGQTMVLGVLTMLMLFVTTLIGFNLTHSVHERIRIQSAADAQAYSVAVMQARAFNASAYVNRTIAAILVAQTGLHAWMNISLNDVAILQAATVGMGRASVYEFTKAKCSDKTPHHCVHATEAGIIATKLYAKAQQYEAELNASVPTFNQASEQLREAHRKAYKQNKDYLKQIKDAMQSGSDVLKNMLQATAPRAKFQAQVDKANKASFACTFEGTDFDGECQKVEKLVFDRQVLGAKERAQLMIDAATAARPKFQEKGDTSQTDSAKDLASKDFTGTKKGTTLRNPDIVMQEMGEGEFILTYTNESFSSRVDDQKIQASSQSIFGPKKSSLKWKDAPHSFTHLGMAIQTSARTPNKLSTAWGSMSSNGYEGFSCSGQDCFANFRVMSGSDNDDGQPSTFGAVTQDTRELQNGGKGAYELNQNATVSLKIGQQATKVQLAARESALAVSKGKAYFHQLGASWAIRPNMFDPFWRAKLHPFRDKDELKAALDLAGEKNSQIAESLPVEGKQ